MKPLVSIIIVKYQSEEYLADCLTSIGKNPKWEIIIIDNDQENVGYGAGCNRGVEKAKGKYLFFLNPDTVVQSGAIEELIWFLENNEDVGISAPLLLDKDKKQYSFQGTDELTPLTAIFAFSFINKFWPNNPISKKYWLVDWDKKSPREIAVVPGTALMIRRVVFRKVGGFDENFFLYFEESDLCKRVRKAGWKIFFQPKAKVIHFWGKSGEGKKENKKIFRESRFYFLKKHYGFLPSLLVEIFLRGF